MLFLGCLSLFVKNEYHHRLCREKMRSIVITLYVDRRSTARAARPLPCGASEGVAACRMPLRAAGPPLGVTWVTGAGCWASAVWGHVGGRVAVHNVSGRC